MSQSIAPSSSTRPSPDRRHRAAGELAGAARIAATLEDPARLAALRATGLLDEAEPPSVLVRAARLAARALHAPVAQVNLLTEGTQVPVAIHVEPPHGRAAWSGAVTLERSLCKHVVATGMPLAVDELRLHPGLRDDGPARAAGIVGYLAVPLAIASANGGPAAVIGSLCVVDVVPRAWTDADVETMHDLAAAVVAESETRSGARSAVQQVEQQMARLLAAAGEGVLGTDAAGHTTFVNPAAERLLGWSAAELTGKEQHAMIHHSRADGRPYPVDECPLQRARLAGRPCRVDDEVFWRRDGSAFPVEYSMTPILDDGRVTGTVLTFQDVTSRRRAEAAERAARDAAERANRAKSEFLAVMSHELRTPLNAIGGYTELLDMGLRGPVTDAQRSDLARIRRSQQHLLGLINDVLNFAKLEAGHAQYEIEDVAVTQLLEDVVSLVRPQIEGKGLTLTEGRCPPTLAVRADREKLEQVLLNLLSNAAKFTEVPGTIVISCSADDAAVRIEVRDSGIGIPAERLEQIFDPFVQVDPRLARAQEGTGLGLAISRDLARGMAGDLAVASTLGAGSTFSLTLARAADQATASTREQRATELTGAVDRLRALFADAGPYGVLRFLNARTSHRFTGLYRFDPPMLRNVALCDADSAEAPVGADAPLRETYCAIVGETGGGFALADARTDARVRAHPARDSVVSYCGALVRDARGVPVGTLCHFDNVARPVPAEEIPLLEAAARLLGDTVARHADARD